MLRKLCSLFVLLLTASFTANLVNLITHRHVFHTQEIEPIKTSNSTKCVSDGITIKTGSNLPYSKLNTAFITGGIGAYGKNPKISKCFAFMESLVSIGGWNGKVYLMTDGSFEVPPKILQLLPKNIVIVPINTQLNGSNTDFGTHTKGGASGFLKTIIFNSKQIKEDILIWHDCDKIITKPNCISNMFENNFKFFINWNAEIDNTNIYLGRNAQNGMCIRNRGHWDKYQRCGEGIHCGVMMVHRMLSKDILNKWQLRILSEPSTYDRYNFYNAWIVDSPNAKVGQVPNDFLDLKYNYLEGGTTNCVVHITNGRWKVSQNRLPLTNVLQSLCLESVSMDMLLNAYNTPK